MYITSNNPRKLEEFYIRLKKERNNVDIQKKHISQAMGFDVIVNIDINMTEILINAIEAYIGFQLVKLYIKRSKEEEKEPVDITQLENLKELSSKSKDIDENFELYIEYKKDLEKKCQKE